jgi:NADPH:quinone reductase-like Zn-dependent oxidoreductase
LAAHVDGDAPDLSQRLLEVAGPIDCVIDNVGAPAVFEAYRPVLADLGRIIVSGGINHDPMPLRLLPFYLRSQSLIGVRTGNRAAIAAMWDDVRRGFRPPDTHIHHPSWV